MERLPRLSVSLFTGVPWLFVGLAWLRTGFPIIISGCYGFNTFPVRLVLNARLAFIDLICFHGIKIYLIETHCIAWSNRLNGKY